MKSVDREEQSQILDWRADPKVKQLHDRLAELARLEAEAETTLTAASIDADKFNQDLDVGRVDIFAGHGDQAQVDQLGVLLRNARMAMEDARRIRDEAAHDAALVQRALAPLVAQAKQRAVERFREVYPELIKNFITAMVSPLMLYQAIGEVYRSAHDQFPSYEPGFPTAAGLQPSGWDLPESLARWADEQSGEFARRWARYFQDQAAREAAGKAEKAAAAQQPEGSYQWYQRQRAGLDE